MLKLERILAPTDFSESSQKAAEYACELAKKFGAEVHLLHIVETPISAMPSPGAPLPASLVSDLESNASKLLQEWPMDEDIAVTRKLVHGAPFVEVVRYSKEHNVDLIVMGTHGLSGLTHALIGSVAERVVRKAPCPVLTVRPEGHQFVMP